MKKILYICGGTVSLTLGLVGIFIPVLPTTPFLLLASFCYLRSSKRMYEWLMHHKIFGAYLYSYLKYKAIPKKTKLRALLFLWSTLIVSMVIVSSTHISIFLVAVGIGVTIHLMTLKTLSEEDLRTLNAMYCKQTKEGEYHSRY